MGIGTLCSLSDILMTTHMIPMSTCTHIYICGVHFSIPYKICPLEGCNSNASVFNFWDIVLGTVTNVSRGPDADSNVNSLYD